MAISLALMCVYHGSTDHFLYTDATLFLPTSPALAYGQHRVFKSPFKRVRTTSISSLASIESGSQSGQTTPSMDSSKLSPNKLEKTQVVDLNSTHERLAPTPEPSINSLAKLLPQPPPK